MCPIEARLLEELPDLYSDIILCVREHSHEFKYRHTQFPDPHPKLNILCLLKVGGHLSYWQWGCAQAL